MSCSGMMVPLSRKIPEIISEKHSISADRPGAEGDSAPLPETRRKEKAGLLRHEDIRDSARMAPRSGRVHIETRPHGNLQRRLRHAVVRRGTGLVHAGREHIAVPAHDNIHNDRSAAGTFIGRNGQIHGMADRPGEREGDRHPAGDSGIPSSERSNSSRVSSLSDSSISSACSLETAFFTSP